jgi:glycerol uptake facilitator-like aquaporin
MKKYLIEGIGTFFLVLVIALSSNPIAIGAILVALVYMGGYISGAHYNPAVTLAIWMQGKLKAREAQRYMGAQMIGAFLAALTFFVIKGKVFVAGPGAGVSFGTAVLVELLLTFILVSVVLHTATTPKTEGNDYYGLAIGLTVMGIAFTGGSISGGAFNPAVGVAPLLFNIANLGHNVSNLLIYLLGPLAGGVLASWVYDLTK